MKKVLLLIFMSCVLVLCGCGNTPASQETSAPSEYNVTVVTEGGMNVSNVEVRVYSAEDSDDLVWAGYTDASGKFAFESNGETEFIVKFGDLPQGYAQPEDCTISQQYSLLRLKTVFADPGDMTGYTCDLGTIIRDFTVVTTDGTEYRFSDLIKERKTIILNFWFEGCVPCKMEFPYLQQAYEKYKSDAIVLAINPLDGTNKSITEYANDLGLTFPMAVGDVGWGRCMNLTGFPTTVVIDRYGMITMRHMGSITNFETFDKIFGFFTSENYVQTIVKDIEDIQ